MLGLFEPSHMRFEADRADDGAGEPSLAELTVFALDRLDRNPRGYVLMVEAGRIDHGHHANNAYRALHDTLALSDAVAAALARVDLDETLVVVTADHGHVFTVAGYPTRGNPILGLVRSNDGRGEPAPQPARDGLGRPYTTLGYANGPGYPAASSDQPEGAKRFPHFPRSWEDAPVARADLAEIDPAAPDHLQESAVPLGSETHSGEDVAIYAAGPGSALFHGVQEQSYVYHAAVAALGWDREPGWLERTLAARARPVRPDRRTRVDSSPHSSMKTVRTRTPGNLAHAASLALPAAIVAIAISGDAAGALLFYVGIALVLFALAGQVATSTRRAWLRRLTTAAYLTILAPLLLVAAIHAKNVADYGPFVADTADAIFQTDAREAIQYVLVYSGLPTIVLALLWMILVLATGLMALGARYPQRRGWAALGPSLLMLACGAWAALAHSDGALTMLGEAREYGRMLREYRESRDRLREGGLLPELDLGRSHGGRAPPHDSRL